MGCNACTTVLLPSHTLDTSNGCDLDCIPFADGSTRNLQDINCADCAQLFTNYPAALATGRGNLLQRCLAKCSIPGATGGLQQFSDQDESNSGSGSGSDTIKKANTTVWVVAIIAIALVILMFLIFS